MNIRTNQYNESWQIKLDTSKRMQQMTVFIHVLALFACLANSLAIITQCILFVGVCIHFQFALKRLKNQRYTISYNNASGWQIATDSYFESVQILPSTTITKFAVFLHFNSQNNKSPLLRNKHAVLILYDALSEVDYRRFAVTLKTSFIK